MATALNIYSLTNPYTGLPNVNTGHDPNPDWAAATVVPFYSNPQPQTVLPDPSDVNFGKYNTVQVDARSLAAQDFAQFDVTPASPLGLGANYYGAGTAGLNFNPHPTIPNQAFDYGTYALVQQYLSDNAGIPQGANTGAIFNFRATPENFGFDALHFGQNTTFLTDSGGERSIVDNSPVSAQLLMGRNPALLTWGETASLGGQTSNANSNVFFSGNYLGQPPDTHTSQGYRSYLNNLVQDITADFNVNRSSQPQDLASLLSRPQNSLTQTSFNLLYGSTYGLFRYY